MIGETVNQFKILRKLGEGGMGAVYLATDTELDRKVALKFLPAGSTIDPEISARFKREAKAAAALNHPNIVTVFEIGEHGGQSFLVMEHVDGTSLKDKLASQSNVPLRIDEIIEIAGQVCEGLAAAHAADVVHRDIKPDNILITADGRVKIADFGLAKLRGATRLTKEETTMGTVYYMSPEQAVGEDVDSRSDIFSFGVVLYEMITGHLPFSGDYDAAISYAILNEQPEPLARYKSDVSDGLQRIVEKALDKDKETRYQNITDLLTDLKREKRNTSGSGIPVAPAGRQRITTPFILGITAVLILLVVAVSLVYFLNRPPSITAQLTHKQITFTGDATSPSISPDGEFVAYVTGKSDARRVLVQDLSGSQTLPVFDGDSWDLHWSPDGAEIAFNAADTNYSDIVIVPRLGGEPQTNGGINFQGWSPDGKHLAYGAINLKRIAIRNRETDEAAYISLTGSFQWRFLVDWSPLGDRFLVVTKNQNEYAIWTLKIDGSEQEKILTDDLNLNNARWSANGRAVYYLRFDGETSTLMKLPVDPNTGKASGPPVSLQAGLKFGPHFFLTRDNKRLVYSREINASNLWLVTLKKENGSSTINPIQLTSGTSWHHDPAISPDGKQIAFALGKRPRANIYVMPLEGGDKRQLTFLDSYNAGPAWSPDGTEIAFGSSQDGKNRVWRVTARGGTPRPFVNSKVSSDVYNLTWSPDAKIAYERPGNRNIHFIDVATENEEPLFESPIGWVFLPRLSPKNRLMAAHIFDGRRSGIWTMSVGDEKPNFLREGPLYALKWSNDEKWIYAHTFQTPEVDVWKISADNGAANIIATLPWADSDGEAIGSMSSDEKHIIYPVITFQSDIWLAENFDPENELEHPPEFDQKGLDLLTYLQKGESLIRKREFAQAETLFREGLTVNDEHWMLTKRLADCIQYQNRFAEAERLYREADKITSGDLQIYYELGWSLFHQGKHSEAQTFAEKVMARDSSFTIHNLLARILVSGDLDIDRGLPLARKAVSMKWRNWHHFVEQSPRLAIPEHTVGLAYMKKGEYEMAVQYLEQAADLAPNHQNVDNDLNLAKQKLRESSNN